MTYAHEYVGTPTIKLCEHISVLDADIIIELDYIPPCRPCASNQYTSLIPSNAKNMAEIKTGIDGWRLVRFLPPFNVGITNTWYSYVDGLSGIDKQGDSTSTNNEWTVPFGRFDEFVFSTHNFAHWLYCSKYEAIGYENEVWCTAAVCKTSPSPILRQITRSSIGSNYSV